MMTNGRSDCKASMAAGSGQRRDGASAVGGRPPKPARMPVRAENIPASLRVLVRWVCWNWTWNGRKWDKPPLDPRTGKLASSTDPSTWCDFTTAYDAHRRGDYDGLGIVLGRLEDGRTLTGLDLDKCYGPGRTLSPLASCLLGTLDSYAEDSPSGAGVKALAWGELPRGKRADHGRGVELYDGARYFTLTGHRLGQYPAEVMDRTDRLRQLHATVFPGQTKAQADGRLTDRELALSALAGLSRQRAAGYHDWIGVGMALHSVDPSEAMLAEWDRWSRGCPEKYAEGACRHKWESFAGGGGLTLGSLIYWAREDGWTPPRHPGGGSRSTPWPGAETDEPQGDGEQEPAQRRPAAGVILDHLRATYQPAFRRGDRVWSSSLRGEVRRSEALARACDLPLMTTLRLQAVEVPRDEAGNPKVNALPKVYRDWAPTAWAELLRSLPDEPEGEEVD
ncbi:MAG TPA: PriCT-2 domain-containing protein, partial [Gemmataceae bacterium]|nr:PriCT-2 domain-containing protein [Gemmataceae bacterium]